LPFEETFHGQDMATLGEHCYFCSVRPGCAKYLSALSEGAGDSLPFIADGDIYGNVIETSVADGLVKVRLECEGAKRVTVTGIPEVLWGGGNTIFMFALRTKEVSGRTRYVANYHVLDVTQPQNSAFEHLTISGAELP
jgi:hypothetical protein